MKNKLHWALLAALSLTACSDQEANNTVQPVEPAAQPVVTEPVEKQTAVVSENPLMKVWDTPFGIPPFDQVKDEHYLPAFENAVESMKAEVKAITMNEEAPSFDNTIVALEQSGKEMGRIISLFSNITGTDTNDALKAL